MRHPSPLSRVKFCCDVSCEPSHTAKTESKLGPDTNTCFLCHQNLLCHCSHYRSLSTLVTMNSPRMNILCLFVASMSLVSAWVAPAFLRNGGARRSSLNVASRDDLEYLPLSSSDLSRLTLMRERHTTLPIVISEAMLPGQVLEMGSADPKFIQLLQQVLSSKTGEFGMIGINPHTGRPLNIGVRCSSRLTTSESVVSHL